MQHLGANEELVQVMVDFVKTLSLEEAAEFFADTPIEQRLAGIAPEERCED